MSTISEIESLAKSLADARQELADRLQRIKDEQDTVKRRYLQGVKNSVERVRAVHAELHTMLSDAQALFEKPKTRVIHGLRLGWMKQRGKVEFDDPALVIAALRKLLGEDEAAQYIQTKESPIKDRLSELPAKDLKRCHVSITDDTESVVIKSAGGEIDKLIDALLGSDELEELVS